MKKKILVIGFLTLLFSIGNVNAYTKGDKFNNPTYGANNTNRILGNKGDFKRLEEVYNDKIYYVIEKSSDNDKKYYAYCVDPELSGSTDLVVDRLLNSNSKKNKYEIGALAIMAAGQNTKPDVVATSTDEKEYYEETITAEKKYYEATLTALRMYVNGVWRNEYGETHSEQKYLKSYLKTLYDWLAADSDLQGMFKKVTGKEYTSVLKAYAKETPFVIVDSVKNEAIRLLKAGMEAAANYKDGDEAVVEIDIVGEKAVENSDSKLIVVQIALDKFNATSGTFYYTGIKDKNENTSVKLLGYALEYSDKASDYSNALKTTDNIVSILNDNDKDSIYLAFEASADEGEDKKCTATFYIGYEYSDTTIYNGAVLMQDSGRAVKSLQRFFMYSDEPLEEKFAIKNQTCDSVCDISFGDFSSSICSDDAEVDPQTNKVTYTVKEGLDAEGVLNIEKCILENTDKANNSYELRDDSIITDNVYCTVYCKEDYEFSVPYKIETEAGRYFQIGMDIKGQKDCYTTELNKDKFDEDIEELEAKIIEYFNAWSKNKALSELQVNDTWDANKQQCVNYTCGCDSKIANYGDYGSTHGVYYTYQFLGDDFIFRTRTEFESYGKKEIQENSCINQNALDLSGVSRHYGRSFYGIIGTAYTYYNVPQDWPVLLWYDGIYLDGIKFYTYEELMYITGTIVETGESIEANQTCQSSISGGEDKCEVELASAHYERMHSQYVSAMEEAETNLKVTIEKLKQAVDSYNGCADIDENYNVESYSNVGSLNWDITYNFDPVIKYDYDEPQTSATKWIDLASGINVMETISKTIEAEACAEDSSNCQIKSEVTLLDDTKLDVTTRCVGGVNSDYTCKGNAMPGFNNKNIIDCSFENGELSCSNKTYKITNVSHVHKTAVASGTYDTPRVYYSLHGRGQVVVNPFNKDNADLIDGLPVGIDTPVGKYFYIIGIENLGEYYSEKKGLGRIFGTGYNSLTTISREEDTTVDGMSIAPNEYACTYAVSESTCEDAQGVTHNKTECELGEDWETCKNRLCPSTGKYCVKEAEAYYICDGKVYNESCTGYGSRDEALAVIGYNEKYNYSCCPDCEITCVGAGCIYIPDPDPSKPSSGGGSLNVEFRPITPSEINPNNHTLGFNWDINNTNKLVANKAYNTIMEIESRNDNVTTNPDPGTVETVEDYVMAVELTPTMVNYVKEYNAEQIANGQYNNDTLVCYDYRLENYTESDCKAAGYNWDGNVCAMTNIFCYSTFLDGLTAEFADNVESDARNTAKNAANENYKYYNEFKTKYKNGSLDSAEIGSNIVTNDYWTIYTYTKLDVTGDGLPDIGPSWK